MNTYEIHYTVRENTFGKGYNGKLLAQADSMKEGIKQIKTFVLGNLKGILENPEFFFTGGFQTNK